jgi:type II secretory pathway component HofQ
MKKVVLLFVFILSASILLAGLDEKLTIEFKDTDIRDIAKVICKSGDFGVALEKSVRGNLTISIKDVSVARLLDSPGPKLAILFLLQTKNALKIK